jgi:phosphatidylserine/phosphatidylglycerophosphate/cardiolipin synthase-like enzyme
MPVPAVGEPGKPTSPDQEEMRMDAGDSGSADTEATLAFPPPGARLAKALGRTSDAPLREGNRLKLLKNGPHTYDDWLAAIARAQRWVHLDNYIFQDDTTGNRFAEALTTKAAEGVRVRVLHDWFGCMYVPRSFWHELQEAGVKVRAVNPPTLGAPLGGLREAMRERRSVRLCCDESPHG